MRKFCIIIILFSSILSFAQAPARFNYQAVARNTSGNLIINQNISVRISILTGSTTGATEYSETHSVTTDAFGVFNLLVGGGTVVSGSFEAITWGTESKFLKIEADITGGTTYQTLATTQILSVPYALYANKSGDAFSGDYTDLTNKPAVIWADENGHIYANNITSTSSVAITDEGLLGIGTNNPLGEIHVNKPIGFSGITFTGTGTNDLNVNYGNFTGTGNIEYIVEVNNSGPDPDLIRWSNNGGSTWASDIPMQTNGIDLGDGTLIGFTTVDGHTYADKWQFTVSQGFMNGFIVRDGKVGISTTTPSENLEVIGTIKATSFSGDGSNLTGIASGTGGVINTGSTTIGADSDADNNGIIAFQTRGTTKAVIDNVGNIGIGTDVPVVKLDVIGSINSTSPDDNSDILLNLKGRYTGISGSLFNETSNSGLLLQMKRAKGKISVPAIVSPNDILGSIEAYGYDGTAFNISSSINFIADEDPKSGAIPGRITFSTRANNNTTGLSERFRITEAGSVGIGTSTPTEMLDVNGNIKAISYLGDGAGLTGIASGTGGLINSGSTTIGADSDKDGMGEIAFQTKDTTRIIITNEGNIGIGSNVPSGLFQITSDKNIVLDSTLIFTKGKLGIGVLDPVEKLEVNGKVKATLIEANSAIIAESSTIAGVNIPGAMVPIGAIIPWAKNLTGVPSLSENYVECNGQVLNDPESPLNGQTMPNLNILKRFLRGSSSSGTTGGSDSHLHQWLRSLSGVTGGYLSRGSGEEGSWDSAGNQVNMGSGQKYTSVVNSLPPYYEVVYIIRVK